jgi:hypothetical protein
MGTFGPRRILRALVVLSALALAVPAHARAADCGADYLFCLVDAALELTSSDPLHESECYTDYLYCIRDMILTA